MEENKQEKIEINKDNADFSHVYVIKILFENKVDLPNHEIIKDSLKKAFDEVDTVSDMEGLYSFALNKYMVSYEDNKQMPAQVLIASSQNFDKTTISDFNKSQLWDIKNPDEIIEKCNWQIIISDFLAAGLEYKKRCYIITKWTEIVLGLFPEALAVYYEASGKLLTAEQVKTNPYGEDLRFLYGGVNIRFFNVEGTNDMVVDTFGMYAIGLPDIQYHFHDLEVNKVVNHAYSTMAYIFDKGDVIKSGDTIASFLSNDRWKCQYEKSLIKPFREVLDINTGEYAAGKR